MVTDTTVVAGMITIMTKLQCGAAATTTATHETMDTITMNPVPVRADIVPRTQRGITTTDGFIIVGTTATATVGINGRRAPLAVQISDGRQALR